MPALHNAAGAHKVPHKAAGTTTLAFSRVFSMPWTRPCHSRTLQFMNERLHSDFTELETLCRQTCHKSSIQDFIVPRTFATPGDYRSSCAITNHDDVFKRDMIVSSYMIATRNVHKTNNGEAEKENCNHKSQNRKIVVEFLNN